MSKAERTREFIIEKSAPVFNKKGYAGASLSDITKAAGLTKGSIYGNFKNKEELALCAFRKNLDLAVGVIIREMEAANGAINKLMVYPRFYKKIYDSMAAIGGCPIVNTLVEADDTNPEFLKLALQSIDLWKEAVIGLIEMGQKDGEIKLDVNPDASAELIITLVEGGSLLAKATGRESYVQGAIDHVAFIIQSMRAGS